MTENRQNMSKTNIPQAWKFWGANMTLFRLLLIVFFCLWLEAYDVISCLSVNEPGYNIMWTWQSVMECQKLKRNIWLLGWIPALLQYLIRKKLGCGNGVNSKKRKKFGTSFVEIQSSPSLLCPETICKLFNHFLGYSEFYHNFVNQNHMCFFYWQHRITKSYLFRPQGR